MAAAALSAAILLWLSPSLAAGFEERKVASREAVKEFAGRLKGELQGAMKAGGPLKAVKVCSQRAQVIAGEISREKGMEIGRTSLRVRNPANAPDAWERAALESFEERRKGGESLDAMEEAEVVKEDGKEVFRYLKAIPLQKVCLTCHGSELAPDLSRKISEIYPDDRATGFREGDLRGAFTVRSRL